MVSIATKTDTQTVNASEFNQLPDELENVVSASGQTPSAGTLDQVAKGIVNISSNGDFYTDSGVADGYVLTAISPNKSPTSYRTGMQIRFRTSNANTGASTINVASLGVKNIKKQDGTTDPSANDISTTRENKAVYDGTSFRLTSVGSERDASSSSEGISFYNNNFIYGLVPSSNSTTPDEDLDITSGKALCKDGSTIVSLYSDETALSMPTLLGSGLAVDTAYHLFRYKKNDATNQWHIDTSTTPTISDINSANAYRRIFSFITDGSGDIIEFTGREEFGNIDIIYSERITEYGLATSLTSGALDLTLPTGINVKVKLSLNHEDGSVCVYKLREENQISGFILSQGGVSASKGGSSYDIYTNTSGQIFHDDSNTDGEKTIYNYGYIDNRINN